MFLRRTTLLFLLLAFLVAGAYLVHESVQSPTAVAKKKKPPLPKFIGNPYWECVNNEDPETECSDDSLYTTWELKFQVSLCSDGANRVWMWEDVYSSAGFYGKLRCNRTHLIGDDIDYASKLIMVPVYQVHFKAKRKGKPRCWSIAPEFVARIKC